MGTDLIQLTGEDGNALEFNRRGGVGCISVSANVAPKLCSDMQLAWREKDIQKAQKINLMLAKLHNSLFLESSPGPVKYAASLLGLCTSETRLPLVEINEKTKKRFHGAPKTKIVFSCDALYLTRPQKTLPEPEN